MIGAKNKKQKTVVTLWERIYDNRLGIYNNGNRLEQQRDCT